MHGRPEACDPRNIHTGHAGDGCFDPVFGSVAVGIWAAEALELQVLSLTASRLCTFSQKRRTGTLAAGRTGGGADIDIDAVGGDERIAADIGAVHIDLQGAGVNGRNRGAGALGRDGPR